MRDLRRALRYMPLLGGLAPPPPSPRYPFQPFVAAPLPSNPLPLCPSRALPLAGLVAALPLAAPRRRPIASPRACSSALRRLFAADSSVEFDPFCASLLSAMRNDAGCSQFGTRRLDGVGGGVIELAIRHRGHPSII